MTEVAFHPDVYASWLEERGLSESEQKASETLSGAFLQLISRNDDWLIVATTSSIEPEVGFEKELLEKLRAAIGTRCGVVLFDEKKWSVGRLLPIRSMLKNLKTVVFLGLELQTIELELFTALNMIQSVSPKDLRINPAQKKELWAQICYLKK
jgi:hypothetical protein